MAANQEPNLGFDETSPRSSEPGLLSGPGMLASASKHDTRLQDEAPSHPASNLRTPEEPRIAEVQNSAQPSRVVQTQDRSTASTPASEATPGAASRVGTFGAASESHIHVEPRSPTISPLQDEAEASRSFGSQPQAMIHPSSGSSESSMALVTESLGSSMPVAPAGNDDVASAPSVIPATMSATSASPTQFIESFGLGPQPQPQFMNFQASSIPSTIYLGGTETRNPHLPQVPDLIAKLLESEEDNNYIQMEVRGCVLHGNESTEDLGLRRLVRYARHGLTRGEAGYCAECCSPAALYCGGCQELPVCSQECLIQSWAQHRFLCSAARQADRRADAQPGRKNSVIGMYFPANHEAPSLQRVQLLDDNDRGCLPRHPDLPSNSLMSTSLDHPERAMPDLPGTFRMFYRASSPLPNRSLANYIGPRVASMWGGPLFVVLLRFGSAEDGLCASDYADMSLAMAHDLSKVLDDYVIGQTARR